MATYNIQNVTKITIYKQPNNTASIFLTYENKSFNIVHINFSG